MTKNIVIVAHKFLTQPDDELVAYLNQNAYMNVLHVMHSFPDAADRRSYYQWYQNGKLIKEYRSFDYKGLPDWMIYAKETFFTLYWIGRSGVTWGHFIGMDGLCTFWGILLRIIRRVRKVAFWAIDFVPNNRFESKIKNLIYSRINTFSYKNCDEMWDLSPRMLEARERFMEIKPADYRSHNVVPYGMWIDRIKRYDIAECEQQTLVFMGHLLKKQGVQQVITALPAIIKKVPAFRFKILGTGNYQPSLLELAKNLNVLEHCDFVGYIEDIRELEDQVARSAVGIAPYLEQKDSWTYYADPGKVKTYLACGIPVILTDVPWNARDIETHHCGKVIKLAPNLIAEAVVSYLSTPSLLQVQRKKAVEYARKFDYHQIFSESMGL